MICDACKGLGWVQVPAPVLPGFEHLATPGTWPEKCATCKGSGRLSRHAVAAALGIHPSTIKRIERGRARRSTCERVLNLLHRIQVV